MTIIAEVNEDSAPPCSALVSMPTSCDEREQDTAKREEGGYALLVFKKALYDGRIHHFILIHLSDFGPNDVLRETFH
jgi:hypothetical protein